MQTEHFPALFRCADEASNRSQSFYLRLIRLEYGLLMLAALFSMSVLGGPTFYTVYAIIFLASIGVLLTRALSKPEQDWYKSRALAESVKTLTWRYVMRADPFGSAPDAQAARAEFRDHLHQLFSSNQGIAARIAPDWSAEDQITAEMDNLRALDLEARKALYVRDRVQDQRGWYARKAAFNRRAARKWIAIGVGAYASAMIMALSRIRFPEWSMLPIEPVIVFASSIIGWMQIKKFNELSAAYTVTAHEIGLISPKVEASADESALSASVNESELAFSREHTMWIARQSN